MKINYYDLNVLQKLAIFFYSNIDSKQSKKVSFFKLLEKRSPVLKGALYCGYFSLLVFSLFFANLIFNTLFSFEESIVRDLVILLKTIICYLVLAIGSLPLLYLTLFKHVNVEKVIENKNEVCLVTAKYKKEWWRLRNYHFFVRILFYCALYFISMQVVYYFHIFYLFSEITPQGYVLPTESTNISTSDINFLLSEMEKVMKYFTIVFFVIVIFLENSIRKVSAGNKLKKV